MSPVAFGSRTFWAMATVMLLAGILLGSSCHPGRSVPAYAADPPTTNLEYSQRASTHDQAANLTFDRFDFGNDRCYVVRYAQGVGISCSYGNRILP